MRMRAAALLLLALSLRCLRADFADPAEEMEWCRTMAGSPGCSTVAFLVQDAKRIAVDAATEGIASRQDAGRRRSTACSEPLPAWPR